MMSRVKKGLVAGFAAAVAVSVLEIVNRPLGPWFSSFPRLLSYILQAPDQAALGWVAHFVAGTLILGPLFAIICPRLPTDTPESKGILFAVGAWLLMMVTIAPVAGIGFFGAAAGVGTMAWMLVTHAVFGVVLGGTYGWLVQREKRRAHAANPSNAATA